MNMQINQAKQVSYGAVEANPSNPFNQTIHQPAPTNPYQQQMQSTNPYNPNPGNTYNPFANTTQEETVQPYATDNYMHGNVEERSFQQY
jgi:hypothetical protein